MLDGRWLLERFTNTFLEDWTRASLEREWQFVKARRRGCLPSGQMRQRAIDAGDVAAALSDHVTSRGTDDSEPVRQPSWTPQHFKMLAIERLKTGNTEAAASIFRILYDLDDTDADNLSNLGFCLIPASPTEAIGFLQRAAQIGPTDPEITGLNIALALHLDGQNNEAIEVAVDTAASRDREYGAFMWRVGTDGLVFAHVSDLAAYADDLLDHFAVCSGACLPAGPTLMDATSTA
jgi:hypothetical protein